MDQGLDDLSTLSMTLTQNRQASASYGSQCEMERANVKQEQQEGKQTSYPQPRPPQVEPLLSIQRLTSKDIEREQQKLKVKLPSLPKPKPKQRDSTLTTAEGVQKCTGSFKMLRHSLIKRKRHYYYKCKVGDCKASFNRVKSWNIHHLVKHKSVEYKCNKCNKTMPTSSSYRDHLNLHKDTKFACNKCD